MMCPTCSAELFERTLLDPNLRGYACTHGHLFFTTLIDQAGGIPTADTIWPPAMTDDVKTLRFWLTDREARRRVPNQLALVCRRLIDIVEHDHHVAAVDNPFVFCPTCGESLSGFDSRDPYMDGLQCANGHEFWSRGGILHYTESGVRANLSEELADERIPSLIDDYTDLDDYAAPYVHPQLRGVLERFRRADSSAGRK